MPSRRICRGHVCGVSRRHAGCDVRFMSRPKLRATKSRYHAWQGTTDCASLSRPVRRGAEVTLTTRACSYLGAISATCVLLAACMPADGAPVPRPPDSQSAVSATPPETAQEREERLAYEAAEKAYRTFRAEYDRISNTKQTSARPTEAMTENAAGPYLKAMAEFLEYKKSHGQTGDRPIRIAYVKPGGYSPSELILHVCEDGSRVRVFDKQGEVVSRGQISEMIFYVRP